jgi:uncharacterized protein DUF4157/NleD-like pathogen effector protein (putative zinc metallopeptidase)
VQRLIEATAGPKPVLQRRCSCGGVPDASGECAECRRKRLARERAGGSVAEAEAPPLVHDVLRTPGRPLDAATRAFMEPRFGRDFSQVRIHTDGQAAESANVVNAHAYTVGPHIAFGAGRYAPRTSDGRRLLAHELAHVVQQQHSSAPTTRRRRSDDRSNDRASPATTPIDGAHSAPAVSRVRKPRLARTGGPDPLWGGFRIDGNAGFITQVRADLNSINATKTGAAMLSTITTNREPWYRSRIRIQSASVCGMTGSSGTILYNATSCSVPDACRSGGPAWTRVPNLVYLYHEIVHAYLYHVASKGSHADRECMVTGLGGYFASMPSSENQLRCELGLPVRPCYDGQCTAFPAPTCPAATGATTPAALPGQKAAPISRMVDEQSGARGAAHESSLPVVPDDSPLEREAERVADTVMRDTGARARGVESAVAPIVARQPNPARPARAPRQPQRSSRARRELIALELNEPRTRIDTSRAIDEITDQFYDIPIQLLPPNTTIPAGPILTIGPYGCGIRRYGLTTDEFSLSYSLSDRDIRSTRRPFGGSRGSELQVVECWADHVEFHANLSQTILLPKDLASHPCSRGADAATQRAEILAHERGHELDNRLAATETLSRLRERLAFTFGIGSLIAFIRITDDPERVIDECREKLHDRLEQMRKEHEILYARSRADRASERDPHDRALHMRNQRLLEEARAREAKE